MKNRIKIFLIIVLTITTVGIGSKSSVAASTTVNVNKKVSQKVYHPGTETTAYFYIVGYYTRPSGPQDLKVSMSLPTDWSGKISSVTSSRTSTGGLKVRVWFWTRGPYYDSVYAPPTYAYVDIYI